MAYPQVDFLIDKVREAVGDPVLPVVVTVFDKEERIVISAGGRDFSFSDEVIDLHFFWSVAFARMASVVAEGLKESGNG